MIGTLAWEQGLARASHAVKLATPSLPFVPAAIVPLIPPGAPTNNGTVLLPVGLDGVDALFESARFAAHLKSGKTIILVFDTVAAAAAFARLWSEAA